MVWGCIIIAKWYQWVIFINDKRKFQVGDTLKGPTVSKVLFSRSADFNIGDIVNGSFNWEKYLIVVDD